MIDITMKTSESIQVYKNRQEKKPKFSVASDFSNSSVYETVIEMNLHTGTHVDYPKHIFEKGKTSDDYDIGHFSGSSYVVDLSHVSEKITFEDIKGIDLVLYDFLILKTKNSFSDDFDFDFVYLAEDAARHISHFNLKGVGIDGLGIERAQEGHPTHRALLSKDILIFEGLSLKDVEEGAYEFYGIPTSISNVEASPVRAFLKQ